jgi:phospholipase/carboxylesterase
MLTGPERKPLSGLAPRHIVVLVHGYGANGEDLISLADELGEYLPDTYFIAPNAPTPLEHSFGGFQWFPIREISEEAMMAGVKSATPVLNEFIDHQLLQHNLTIDRVALVGFSQGTMISLYSALRRPKPCAAVVGFSGLLMGSKELKGEMKSKPPVCLVHGTADSVVPFHFMAEAEEALKEAGVEVEVHERPGLAHGIDLQGLTIAKDFLRKHLL